MGKRDVSEAALRMFIKQPGVYVGVPEEIELDLRFHEVGGSTEFFHIRNSCTVIRQAYQKMPRNNSLQGVVDRLTRMSVY